MCKKMYLFRCGKHMGRAYMEASFIQERGVLLTFR